MHIAQKVKGKHSLLIVCVSMSIYGPYDNKQLQYGAEIDGWEIMTMAISTQLFLQPPVECYGIVTSKYSI